MFHHKRRGFWSRWISGPIEGIGRWWWNFKRQWYQRLRLRNILGFTKHITQRIWAGILYPFIMLSHVSQMAYQMLGAWWQIRNFRFLIRGLPALLAVLTIVVIGTYTALRSDDGLQNLYLTTARSGAGDKDTRMLCNERLVQLDSKHQPYIYSLARSCMENGNTARGMTYINALANPDRDDGYPQAHFEKAVEIFQREKKTPENIKLIEVHLRRALKFDANNERANELLGRLLLLTAPDRHDEALRALEKAKSYDALSMVARYQMSIGKMEEAQRTTRIIFDQLKNRVENDIDDIGARTNLAVSYLTLEQFPEAIEVLKRGYELKPSFQMSNQIGECFFVWANHIAKNKSKFKDPKEASRQQVELLKEALSYDEAHWAALNMLSNLIREGSADAETVLNLVTKYPRSYMVHFFVGTVYHFQGRTQEAFQHWEDAYKINPSFPIIANNYAWMLAMADANMVRSPNFRPDALRAMVILDETIKVAPTNSPWLSNLYGTKGAIFLKQRRFMEAADMYKRAVELSKTDAQSAAVHHGLAEAYRLMTPPRMDLANAHEKRSLEFDARVAASRTQQVGK